MNRQAFVFSWGRKIIFGLGWILIGVVALNYFQSMIIPQTFVGWLYFLTTFLGHYGLMLSVLYFVFYCPVVYLFPKYYVAKIWSTFLLISLSVLIFLDSHIFSRYRYHINVFFWDLIKKGDLNELMGLSALGFSILIFVSCVIFLVLWIRGERTWRSMQSRFSNPIKNWYLVFIGVCLLISHTMYLLGNARGASYITRISTLFPLYYPVTEGEWLTTYGHTTKVDLPYRGYKDFYYPKSELRCGSKLSQNILMIVLKKWKTSEFTGKMTPHLSHASTHARIYEHHLSGGNNPSDGLFSLLYSLPPVYRVPALNAESTPVLFEELKKRDYEIMIHSSKGNLEEIAHMFPKKENTSWEGFNNLLSEHGSKPFFGFVYLDDQGPLFDKDKKIEALLKKLYESNQLDSTIVVVTGASGKNSDPREYSLENLSTPLIIFWPTREIGLEEKYTSHYDIIPSILQHGFDCKNAVTDYSFGQSVFSKNNNDFHTVGDYSHLGIMNLKEKTITTINNFSSLEVTDFESKFISDEKEKIISVLPTLKHLSIFFRRH